MKWMIYAVVIAAACLAPVERTDVGKLQPIEVVMIQFEEDTVTIRTDQGDQGCGATVQAALEEMKNTAPGIIYLDTAEYLIIGPGGETCIEQTREYLKNSVRICRTEGDPDLQTAAGYLDIHRPNEKLGQWKQGMPLQTLLSEDDRYKLI